jgi:hypothetical protein
VNTDGVVDAGDIACAVLLAANGACKKRGSDRARPRLTIAEEVPASSGNLVTVPITFSPKDTQVSSLTFSVDYDKTLLSFDPTDTDQDGIPDALTLHLAKAFQTAVRFQARDTRGELDVTIADLALPLKALPDGPLFSLTLRAAVVAEPTTAAVRFAQRPQASLGSTQGYSVPVSTHDGSVRIQKSGAHLAALPDVNGNGFADLAVLLPETPSGKNVVYVKDGNTRKPLSTSTFLRHYTPLALAVLPDFDGNGLPDDPALAVLGRNATGEGRVQLRSAVSGALIQTLSLPELSPIAVAGLPDLNGNSAAELAVLLHDPQSKTNAVHVHDGKTGETLRTLAFLRDYTPLALAVFPDFNGNSRPDDPVLAVLGRNATGEGRVQVRSAVSGALVQTISLSQPTPLALVGLPDINGNAAADLAVLLHDANLEQNSVSVLDGKTGEELMTLAFLANYRPLAMAALPDFDGNGRPDDPVLAVLGRKDTGDVRVQLRDVGTGVLRQSASLPRDQIPLGLAALEDLNNNAAPEVAILSAEPVAGAMRMHVHDAADGKLVIDLPVP